MARDCGRDRARYAAVIARHGQGPSPHRRFACVALVVVAALAVALAAVLGALYVALDPKMPLYTVHALNVTAFGMDDDMTARARFDAAGLPAGAWFDAAVRFENANRAIGISYEEGSSLAVWGAGGALPLVFRGEVPVRVKVGPVTTGKVTPRVRCDLVLDRLSSEGGIGVKRMNCNLKLWTTVQTTAYHWCWINGQLYSLAVVQNAGADKVVAEHALVAGFATSDVTPD
uniref:Late embryogenesis abundant protein LEA-2 subgroup domain-containing protein n=1 Tax=Aegilops tauschii TaxID=37682 RepID=M8BRL4_AEGTA